MTHEDEHAEAHREDWARRTVTDAGKSWLTHHAKFSGAVLPRQSERRRRRRVLPVVVTPEDRDEVYVATVDRA